MVALGSSPQLQLLLFASIALFAGLLLMPARDAAEEHDFEVDDDVATDSVFSFPLASTLRCVFMAASMAFVLLATIVTNQRQLLYKPVVPGTERVTSGINAHPSSWGLRHKDLIIRSCDGTKLHAWLLHQATQRKVSRPAILFFHSNAGDIPQRLKFFGSLCSKLGAVVLALEYRGFGRSEDGGGFSESAFVLDAFAAYKWLLDHALSGDNLVDPDRIYLFGRSLGGCVTVRLLAHLLGADPNSTVPPGFAPAASEPRLPLPAGIILENVPSSIAEAAKQILIPLRFLPSCLLARPFLRDEWRTQEWLAWSGRSLRSESAATARCGVCLLSGARDTVVSPSCMDRLKEAADKAGSYVPVKLHRFPRGGHMDTYLLGGESYWDALQIFCKPSYAKDQD